MDSKTLKGTTTIGLVCSDGVVFATDKRASWGNFVASKRARKSFKINDGVAATVAGSVGDAENLMRLMQAEASLYEISSGERMSSQAVATLLSNILQGSKVFPYLVQLLIGGFDGGVPKLFTLDPVGGLIEEKMAATGSGSPMAYGVLEQRYRESASVAEMLPVAVVALNSAMERDSATGNGVNVVTVTGEGFKEFSEEEVGKLLADAGVAK